MENLEPVSETSESVEDRDLFQVLNLSAEPVIPLPSVSETSDTGVNDLFQMTTLCVDSVLSVPPSESVSETLGAGEERHLLASS